MRRGSPASARSREARTPNLRFLETIAGSCWLPSMWERARQKDGRQVRRSTSTATMSPVGGLEPREHRAGARAAFAEVPEARRGVAQSWSRTVFFRPSHNRHARWSPTQEVRVLLTIAAGAGGAAASERRGQTRACVRRRQELVEERVGQSGPIYPIGGDHRHCLAGAALAEPRVPAGGTILASARVCTLAGDRACGGGGR